jgi:hypothetical protein
MDDTVLPTLPAALANHRPDDTLHLHAQPYGRRHAAVPVDRRRWRRENQSVMRTPSGVIPVSLLRGVSPIGVSPVG